MVRIIPPANKNNVFIPEVNGRNESFEKYVGQTLFPPKKFVLLKQTENVTQHIFIFQDLASGFEFSIECIYRKGLIANGFQTIENSSSKKTTHFVILGLAGTPAEPDQVFLLTSELRGHINFAKRQLREKNIDPAKALTSHQLFGKNRISPFTNKRVA